MDLPGGFEKLWSRREVQKSAFARFLGLLDFRLLQQYQGQSGKHLLALSFSGFDPDRTSFEKA
jgi:hypothetical protein